MGRVKWWMQGSGTTSLGEKSTKVECSRGKRHRDGRA
jgi:hypothetical protein